MTKKKRSTNLELANALPDDIQKNEEQKNFKRTIKQFFY